MCRYLLDQAHMIVKVICFSVPSDGVIDKHAVFVRNYFLVKCGGWRHCNTHSGVGSIFFSKKRYVAISPSICTHVGERNLLLSAIRRSYWTTTAFLSGILTTSGIRNSRNSFFLCARRPVITYTRQAAMGVAVFGDECEGGQGGGAGYAGVSLLLGTVAAEVKNGYSDCREEGVVVVAACFSGCLAFLV